jgi:hypothetical protein
MFLAPTMAPDWSADRLSKVGAAESITSQIGRTPLFRF